MTDDSDHESRLFVAVDSKHAEHTAVFEDDDEKGYFYVLNRPDNEILSGLEIYDTSTELQVADEDVDILWSEDGHRVALLIWGTIRAVIDLALGTTVHAPLLDRHSAPVSDREWLRGFGDLGSPPHSETGVNDDPISQVEAARDRSLHWKRIGEELGLGPVPAEGPSAFVDDVDHEPVKLFVVAAGGPRSLAAFFEDNGETGDLYVTDRSKHKIIQHVQVYTNSNELNVRPDEVEVRWADKALKCGVLIWGGLRALIDIDNGFNGREFVKSRATPPIRNTEWLKGFRARAIDGSHERTNG
jgi:hypothetical protein